MRPGEADRPNHRSAGRRPATANLPLDALGGPGCWLLNSADFITAGLVNTSDLSYTLPIPNLPQAIKVSLFAQYAAYAPGVNPLGFVTSNGLELVLGGI